MQNPNDPEAQAQWQKVRAKYAGLSQETVEAKPVEDQPIVGPTQPAAIPQGEQEPVARTAAPQGTPQGKSPKDMTLPTEQPAATKVSPEFKPVANAPQKTPPATPETRKWDFEKTFPEPTEEARRELVPDQHYPAPENPEAVKAHFDESAKEYAGYRTAARIARMWVFTSFKYPLPLVGGISAVSHMLDDCLVWHRVRVNGLLYHPVEELAPRSTRPSVKPKSELVEVVVKMLMTYRTMESTC